MLEKMQRFYPADGPSSQLILRFSGVQGQLAQRLESSKAHMTVLQTYLRTCLVPLPSLVVLLSALLKAAGSLRLLC